MFRNQELLYYPTLRNNPSCNIIELNVYNMNYVCVCACVCVCVCVCLRVCVRAGRVLSFELCGPSVMLGVYS